MRYMVCLNGQNYCLILYLHYPNEISFQIVIYLRILLLSCNSIILFSFESCSVKRGFSASAENIDLGQPEQFAQADLSRNFSLPVIFLHEQGPVYLLIKSAVK